MYSVFRQLALLMLLALTGCGKTIQQAGTEQLLTSNAVDRVVADINFTPLAGQKVYFQDQYIKNIKGVGFVNGEYIVSSLRQQIIAANCFLQDDPAGADYIIEARVGALGTDQHEVSYGIPANNLLNSASSMVPTAPAIPAIPEISFAKKEHKVGAAKIGVFAYHKETKQPVWQAGVKADRSRSRESWFLGIGPFQSGTIYDGPMFAGAKVKGPLSRLRGSSNKQNTEEIPVAYQEDHLFPLAQQLQQDKKLKQIEAFQGHVEYASHEDVEQTIKQLSDQAAKLAPAESEEKKEAAK